MGPLSIVGFLRISTAFPSELICSAEPEANWLLSVNDGWQRQQFVILHEVGESLKPPVRELHEVNFLLNLKEGPEKEKRWKIYTEMSQIRKCKLTKKRTTRLRFSLDGLWMFSVTSALEFPAQCPYLCILDSVFSYFWNRLEFDPYSSWECCTTRRAWNSSLVYVSEWLLKLEFNSNWWMSVWWLNVKLWVTGFVYKLYIKDELQLCHRLILDKFIYIFKVCVWDLGIWLAAVSIHGFNTKIHRSPLIRLRLMTGCWWSGMTLSSAVTSAEQLSLFWNVKKTTT